MSVLPFRVPILPEGPLRELKRIARLDEIERITEARKLSKKLRDLGRTPEDWLAVGICDILRTRPFNGYDCLYNMLSNSDPSDPVRQYAVELLDSLPQTTTIANYRKRCLL